MRKSEGIPEPILHFGPSDTFPWHQVDDAKAAIRTARSQLHKLRKYGVITSPWYRSALKILEAGEHQLIKLERGQAEPGVDYSDQGIPHAPGPSSKGKSSARRGPMAPADQVSASTNPAGRDQEPHSYPARLFKRSITTPGTVAQSLGRAAGPFGKIFPNLATAPVDRKTGRKQGINKVGDYA